MAVTCLIRRSGNLADMSIDGGRPLDPETRELVESTLIYTHRKRNFGMDRRAYGAIQLEQRPLYRLDGLGRHVFGAGFIPRLQKLLTDSGRQVRLSRHEPDDLNPRRFELDWGLVMEHFCDRFRPRQRDALAAIAANECGIIKMPTASGKGEIIKASCLMLSKARIDVVVPGKDLVCSLVDRLSMVLPNVGQVGAGKKNHGRVTVYSADSLHLSDGRSDVLLADEVHRLGAPSYAAALARYRYSRNFGLSASPTGRFDGADMEVEALFGPVIFEVSYQEAAGLGLVAPIRVEWVDVKLDHNPCANKQDTAKERWGIWRNTERNAIIAKKALSYGPDVQVLVMVRTLEHALYLRKHLPGFELCHSEQSLEPDELRAYQNKGLIGDDEGLMTAKKRDQMRRDFESGVLKKAIATGVWSTGVDFVGLQVLIRADATASEIADTQIPGRVCRIDGSKEVGLLVDFADQFDDGFRRKAMTRKRHYETHGWEQIKGA